MGWGSGTPVQYPAETRNVNWFQCSCGVSGAGSLRDHQRAVHPELACPDETFVCWDGHIHKASERR